MSYRHELSAGPLLRTVARLPLTLGFCGQASLVGALSNLVAVPLVSFVIVPCALFGMLLLLLCPPLAAPVLWLAAQIAHAQWWLFERMATWPGAHRSEEHTSELQSLMRISYAVFCLQTQTSTQHT